jgi:hypothetical protein
MAHGSSLAKRLETVRRQSKVAAHTAERRMVIAGSAAGLGFLEQRDALPVEIIGIPTKLGIGILASILEANSSGATRRMSGALADASLAVYGYQAVKSKSFIAGDDDYVGEDVGEDVSGDEI